jgi:hypothetical protein
VDSCGFLRAGDWQSSRNPRDLSGGTSLIKAFSQRPQLLSVMRRVAMPATFRESHVTGRQEEMIATVL